jgi:PAS domain S-box-containing protein
MALHLPRSKRTSAGSRQHERRPAEEALQRQVERQALLLEVTSDLIRISDPGELSRTIFERISTMLEVAVCTSYRFDPTGRRLGLEFARGIPPEKLDAIRWLQPGEEYCCVAAPTGGGLMRELGVTACACLPLKASDGRLLGTFAVASVSRERFTDDEIVWLGTIANFLAQAWERLEAEQRSGARDEFLRFSQEAAGLGSWEHDFTADRVIWSDQTRKLLGVKASEPASFALMLSRAHEEDRPRLEEHLLRSLGPNSHHVHHIEFRIVTEDGGVRWLEDQGRVETDAAGMPVRAAGVLREITARKEAEEARERLAAVVTASTDAIYSITLAGIITSWNRAAEQLFGYSAGEMIGQSILCLIPADRHADEDIILASVARGERIENYETRRIGKSGQPIDVSISVSPIRDARGSIIGASKIARDITERKRAEERLRENEERLRFIADRAQVGYWHWEITADRLEWSPLSKQLFGLRADEPMNYARFLAALHPDDREPSNRAVRACLDSGGQTDYDVEYRTLWPDGTVRWIHAKGDAVFADGKPVRMAGIALDVTARKQAVEALRESERRFRQVLESLPQLVWTCATDGTCDYLDPKWVLYTGRSQAEQLGYGWLEQAHPDDRERVMAKWQATVARDETFQVEFRLRRHDGAYRWFRTLALPLRGETGQVLEWFGTSTDIDDLKQAEEALRRQADLLDQSHDAIFTWKLGGGITYWSRGAERLYGYTAEEATGRISHDLLRTRSPVPTHEVEAQVAEQGSWYGELTHTTRDGRTIVVESRQVRVRYDGETYSLETNRDITERKDHEKHVQLLTREVNHRAKNMLSVVTAIARQTASTNPKDFVERFSERMQALSASQDLLIRNDWKGVEITDLVRAQLAHFANLLDARVVLRGPSLRLKAESAQAIGLAVHELATNAGKYGALSTDKGRVNISWTATARTFRMSWTENEGPPVVRPTRRGFGSTVIEAMAKSTVGGEVTILYPRSGLVWHLSCPVENAVAPEERGHNQDAARLS